MFELANFGAKIQIDKKPPTFTKNEFLPKNWAPEQCEGASPETKISFCQMVVLKKKQAKAGMH